MCPQGAGAKPRSHSRKLGRQTYQSNFQLHCTRRLTVYISPRGKRGVLSERIGNVVIGMVGVVVSLFGVVVVLSRGLVGYDEEYERHRLWIGRNTASLVSSGRPPCRWEVERVGSRCSARLRRNALGFPLPYFKWLTGQCSIVTIIHSESFKFGLNMASQVFTLSGNAKAVLRIVQTQVIGSA